MNSCELELYTCVHINEIHLGIKRECYNFIIIEALLRVVQHKYVNTLCIITNMLWMILKG